MRIYIVNQRDAVPDTYPALTLHPDNWDDFGLKTTFFATLWYSKGRALELFDIKIMRLGVTSGGPLLPAVNDVGLPEDCGSLGADYGFYDRVFSLDEEMRRRVLRALRDLATDPGRRSMFEMDHAYGTSLTRLAPARDALKRVLHMFPLGTDEKSEAVLEGIDGPLDAGVLLSEAEGGSTPVELLVVDVMGGRPLRIDFEPPPRTGRAFFPPVISFDFTGPPELPGNLVALVGPNGSGKTTLLAELALAVFFGSRTPSGASTGSLEVVSGATRDVIFISYSAYDKFEVPQGQELGKDARADLARQGYVYVGLRKLEQDGEGDDRLREHRLKSIQEIDDEFVAALERLALAGGAGKSEHQHDREALFASALRTILSDPSFASVTDAPRNPKKHEVIQLVRRLFPGMSTGHKAVLNITASLCLHLKPGSLVLMDEPEAHLHPPLVATLLKVGRDLLKQFDANAIVATHSPIVVQETLGQHVLVFDRTPDGTNWMSSKRQTFGENVAALTREVFGLPAAVTDYIDVLEQRLVLNPSLHDLELLFGERRLSGPARAQAIRIIAKLRDKERR